MWQRTFDMDESWGQDAIRARLVAREQILPAERLLQNTVNIFEPAKWVSMSSAPCILRPQWFCSMTGYPESGITISGKPSLRNVCQQCKRPVFSLLRMGFILTDTLVQPYQNLQCLFIYAEKGPPSNCDHTVVSSHQPGKMILLVNWPLNSMLWLSVLLSFAHSPCELQTKKSTML